MSEEEARARRRSRFASRMEKNRNRRSESRRVKKHPRRARKEKPTTPKFSSRSRGAKFVGYGGHALAPRQQPPLNRSELHGQAAQRFRDLPSSHPRALQPREERDVRGRAPHPYEMIDVWAIASARGVGTVSARSRSGRDRARVARAKGGRPAREVREDTARQAENSGATIEANGPIRGWFVRPKRRNPTRE